MNKTSKIIAIGMSIIVLCISGCSIKKNEGHTEFQELNVESKNVDGLKLVSTRYNKADKTIEVIIKNNRDSDIDLKNLTIYLLNNENQIVTKKSHFESKIIKSNESYNILIYLDEKGVNYDNVSNIIFTYEQ